MYRKKRQDSIFVKIEVEGNRQASEEKGASNFRHHRGIPLVIAKYRKRNAKLRAKSNWKYWIIKFGK